MGSGLRPYQNGSQEKASAKRQRKRWENNIKMEFFWRLTQDLEAWKSLEEGYVKRQAGDKAFFAFINF